MVHLFHTPFPLIKANVCHHKQFSARDMGRLLLPARRTRAASHRSHVTCCACAYKYITSRLPLPHILPHLCPSAADPALFPARGYSRAPRMFHTERRCRGGRRSERDPPSTTFSARPRQMPDEVSTAEEGGRLDRTSSCAGATRAEHASWRARPRRSPRAHATDRVAQSIGAACPRSTRRPALQRRASSG